MFYNLRNKPNSNILFIIPELSAIYPNDITDANEVDIIHPPLGVLYLAAACKNGGYTPSVIDQLSSRSYSQQDIEDFIIQNKINFVGISCTMTACYNAAIRYARLCKSLGCVTILGGVHVSATVNESAADEATDIVIVGEGEETIVEVLDRINNHQDIQGIMGIAYTNDEGKVVVEKKRPLIPNIDCIPFPAYEYIDIKKYVELSALGIISSRGCRNHCSFCTSHCTWQQSVRFRSPDNIIEEIDWLVKKYGYAGKELLFYDDNFTLDRERVIAICRLLQERNYGLKWKCMSRVNGIDKELFDEMAKAGCYAVSFGFESAVEESLRRMGKGISLSDMERALSICEESNIQALGYFIIGFPWETKADMEVTVDFIMRHPSMESALNFLTPFPGTPYYDTPEKWNITIDPDFDKFTTKSVVMRTSTYTTQELYDVYARYLAHMEDDAL